MINWMCKRNFKEYYMLITKKKNNKPPQTHWVCCYQGTVKSNKDISRRLTDFFVCIFRTKYWATVLFDLEDFVRTWYSNTLTWGKSLLFWFKHLFMESFFLLLLLQSVDALCMLDEVHFPNNKQQKCILFRALMVSCWWHKSGIVEIAVFSKEMLRWNIDVSVQ